MWQVKINGINKEQFLDVCFMSVECKHSYNKPTELNAFYELKKYLKEDMKDLQEQYPNITYEVSKCTSFVI